MLKSMPAGVMDPGTILEDMSRRMCLSCDVESWVVPGRD